MAKKTNVEANYSVEIVEASMELNARAKIILKDTSDAHKLDALVDADGIVIAPANYAILAIHNDKADDPDYKNYLIIDKGSRHGVEEDMGVITPKGVVGITRGVSENYSYVLSFLNLNQQVSAKIGSTNAFGPLSWDMEHEGKAVLNEIPQHLAVQQQDTVYTSGYSYFYPPDIPLGTVIDSKVVNGVHLRVDVQLLQDFRSISYVMVVKNNNRNEIEKLVQEAK